jgi:hypothetical protein
MIRDLHINDLVILSENNEIPLLFNGPFKLLKSVTNNDELIGSFWARATVEPTIIFKEGISNISRARALDEMINYLYNKIPENLGICDAFIVFEDSFDSQYVDYLKKNYNFQEMKKVLRFTRKDV